MEGTAEIDGDHRIPTLDREVLDVRDMLDACVVHEHIDMSEASGRKLHHVLDLSRLAHVGAVIVDLDVERGNFSLRSLHVAEAVENDVRALLCERFCDTQPDTAGGPRDKRGFAFEHDDSLRMN